MLELFTATHKPTGETFTRNGVPIAATREQWANLGPTIGELTSMRPAYWPWVPLFEGHNDQTPAE
jgi:hypothetical protein